MNRRNTLAAITVSLLIASIALPAGDAFAQSAKQLVGTWTAVSSNAFNPNPRGSLIFTSNGRYSLTLARTTLPKFASNNRVTGTAEENKLIVEGSLSHFGKYTVDEKDKTFTFHVETSTFPNWDGTTQKRPFTVSGDELKYVTPASSGGGRSDLVWKRVK